jgi:ABC-2 type transport system permease protein
VNAILAIARKELLSYFFAPMAYIVASAFLVMNGFLFYIILVALSQPSAGNASPMMLFFGGTLFSWLYLIVTVPVLTMRLGAEEKKAGTLETLLTAPVSDWEVVLGKFAAAFTLYVVLWIPTVLYPLVLSQFGKVDWGPVAGGYLGILLVGAYFISVGLFTSFLSRNQVVSAILAFAILSLLLSMAILPFLVMDPVAKGILDYLDLFSRIQDFAKGLVDTRPVVYFISGTALFLALTRHALEVRRWR